VAVLTTEPGWDTPLLGTEYNDGRRGFFRRPLRADGARVKRYCPTSRTAPLDLSDDAEIHAGERTRTSKGLRPAGPKPAASPSSATPAHGKNIGRSPQALHSARGPVAQWIERQTSNLRAEVRLLAGPYGFAVTTTAFDHRLVDREDGCREPQELGSRVIAAQAPASSDGELPPPEAPGPLDDGRGLLRRSNRMTNRCPSLC
jgi:hypothetical protein